MGRKCCPGRKGLIQSASVAQTLYIPNKDLSLGTALDWLLGDNLRAPGMFYAVGAFCTPEALGRAVPL